MTSVHAESEPGQRAGQPRWSAACMQVWTYHPGMGAAITADYVTSLHYMTCQVWTVLVGLVSRLLRSLFAGLEEEEGQLGPEAGAQCCPDAGAMVSEASVSVSLGQLPVYRCQHVTNS